MITILPFYQLFENERSEGAVRLSKDFYNGNLALSLDHNFVLMPFSSLDLKPPNNETSILDILLGKETIRKEEFEGKLDGNRILLFVEDNELQDYLRQSEDQEIERILKLFKEFNVLFLLPKYRYILGSSYELPTSPFIIRIVNQFKGDHRVKRSFISAINKVRREYMFKLTLFSELLNSNLNSIDDLVELFGNQELVNRYLDDLFLQNLVQLQNDKRIHLQTNTIEELRQAMGQNYNFEQLRSDLETSQKRKNDDYVITPTDVVLQPMNENPKVLNKVLGASLRLKSKDPNSNGNEESEPEEKEFTQEKIITSTQSQFKLRNAKYRSNASMRSGKLVLTDQRLLTYHRKLSIFPTIPFYAYVRINNRVIFIIQQILSYLGAIRPVISGIVRTAGPALAAIFFALIGNVDINISLPIFNIPTVRYFIDLSAENPRLFASLASAIGGLSYGFVRLIRILFYRSRAISVITYPMILGLSSQNKHFRTRSQAPVLILKPKGSDTFPGLKEGMPFRMNLRSKSFKGVPGYLFDDLFSLKIGIIPFIKQ